MCVQPPDGQCALLVYSSTDLPIGGVPTSVEGGGIGPSAVGSPGVFVINMYGDTVGSAALEPQGAGYGFAATFPLDGTLINDAGDIYVTARYVITPGSLLQARMNSPLPPNIDDEHGTNASRAVTSILRRTVGTFIISTRVLIRIPTTSSITSRTRRA